jgi:hypothetical protein
MSTHKIIKKQAGIFFITFTCYQWIKLFQISDSYDRVYKWFDHLKNQGHFIIGYVIMPNHLHAIICFTDSGKNINGIIGNGKRFLAYDIIQNLKLKKQFRMLRFLEYFVSPYEKRKNKIHQVFEPSFDAKECLTLDFLEQKLNYIHENPCQPHWVLVNDPVDYIHSSALYYYTEKQGIYPVTHYEDLEEKHFVYFE